ncbi:hypothetical protein EPR50_G00017450 [Perca flavescens]|uniref:SEA domain-containing protein n=1 Tax=Perca flavescens TaxID=8167 RepID=A0A484DL13_PERFV|nr:hypothetical protein EPR50_G00017450 [Perca flavescens]
MSSPQVNVTSTPRITTIGTTTPLTVQTTVAIIQLRFRLRQNFTSQLTDKSSPEFIQLADVVTTVLNILYSQKYGANFNRTVINSFSQGSVVVDAELIFNNASAVPETSAVANVLVGAVSNSSNFSLPVDASSVVATHLSDSSSTAYQTLAAKVVNEVNNVAKALYGSSYRRSFINSFTSGSVKVSMTLVYADKASVPSASNAASQLSQQLTSSSTSLNIISGSVSTQSTTSSSPPRPTMGSLAVFSLTLLAVAQMLIDL